VSSPSTALQQLALGVAEVIDRQGLEQMHGTNATAAGCWSCMHNSIPDTDDHRKTADHCEQKMPDDKQIWLLPCNSDRPASSDQGARIFFKKT
jgi:hypothetical protein